MSWSIRIFFGGILLLLLWVLMTPPQHLPKQAAAYSKTLSSGQMAAPKITVYQSQGHHGEAHFSDDPLHGRPRVVDQGAGTTFHTRYGGAVPQTASVSYRSSSSTLDPIGRFQQQQVQGQQAMQEIRRQQVERAVGE
ncbi:MAG: hypothetical protein RLY58_132 [Pseudomonadota bacterium]